ncbi:MAG: NUDIX hydrolase [Acidimicrobiales bacterium]
MTGPGAPSTSGVTVAELRRALVRPPRPARIQPDRRAAVAAVFRPVDDELELLFIERAARRSDPWSGQMAFPGGRVDPSDADNQACAERETSEELDLDLSPAELLGRLDDLDGGRATGRPLVVSGHCYLWTGGRPDLRPNHEVAGTVWVPLTDLLDPTRHIAYRYQPAGATFPGIQLDQPQQVIWGLTLRFLADLFERLHQPFLLAHES